MIQVLSYGVSFMLGTWFGIFIIALMAAGSDRRE